MGRIINSIDTITTRYIEWGFTEDPVDLPKKVEYSEHSSTFKGGLFRYGAKLFVSIELASRENRLLRTAGEIGTLVSLYGVGTEATKLIAGVNGSESE
jgi:hypothetical protein